MAHPQIATFARLAKGGDAPARTIAGQATKLSRTMHDIRYDAVNDEFLVTNPFAQAILVFRGGAEGDEPPVRIIQGSRTMLRSPDRLDVNPVHDEIYIPNGDSILVFPRDASGNVAPIRVIRGPNSGIIRITQVAVNPQRKLVIATQPGAIEDMEPEGAFIGVWSLDDNGDVPPRWKIPTGSTSTLKKPRGAVLDPKNKELIVADMRLNAILTYYFPEIF